jgi:phosphohistidine phosphatase SixA
MNYLYLVRHGEALSPEEDLQRPLNEQGHVDVERMAHLLKGKNILIDKIFYSHKQRSMQTAEIIATALNAKSKLTLLPLLDPEESINQLSYYVENLRESAILVGHLPNLDILTAYLLNLGTGLLDFVYSPGSVACLKHADDKYTLEWFISPSEGNGMI